jgi:hypothetical protein
MYISGGQKNVATTPHAKPHTCLPFCAAAAVKGGNINKPPRRNAGELVEEYGVLRNGLQVPSFLRHGFSRCCLSDVRTAVVGEVTLRITVAGCTKLGAALDRE